MSNLMYLHNTRVGACNRVCEHGYFWLKGQLEMHWLQLASRVCRLLSNNSTSLHIVCVIATVTLHCQLLQIKHQPARAYGAACSSLFCCN